MEKSCLGAESEAALSKSRILSSSCSTVDSRCLFSSSSSSIRSSNLETSSLSAPPAMIQNDVGMLDVGPTFSYALKHPITDTYALSI